MTFINGKNIADNVSTNATGPNPFSGVGSFLDAKFNNPISFENATVNNSQNIKVQNNPFNNTENFSFQKQPIGVHSMEYNLSPNSVFDMPTAGAMPTAAGYRDFSTGGLNFES